MGSDAMRRCAALLALLVLPWLAACDDPAPADRAAAWLCARQRPDGTFGSDQYAVLRSGQALTPFVLYALLLHGGGPREKVARGLDAVRASIGPDGAIGYADPDLFEYPVYATSLAVLVLARVGDAGDGARIASMADWLSAQQCSEARGFEPGSAAYGAFGFGARGLRPGDPGHVDVCHTRYALQALAAAGRLDDRVRQRAIVLLDRLQRPDGGFTFSPVVDAANKAGRETGGGFRAYATATADGVLALRALGLRDDEPRLARALGWLARHANACSIGGIDEQPAEPWHDALRFYHAMALAAAWPPLRAELYAMLVARQRPDGSFRSELISAMKEDDPVLATALALHALAAR